MPKRKSEELCSGCDLKKLREYPGAAENCLQKYSGKLSCDSRNLATGPSKWCRDIPAHLSHYENERHVLKVPTRSWSGRHDGRNLVLVCYTIVVYQVHKALRSRELRVTSDRGQPHWPKTPSTDTPPFPASSTDVLRIPFRTHRECHAHLRHFGRLCNLLFGIIPNTHKQVRVKKTLSYLLDGH